MNGYSPKDLLFDVEAREKLVKGIEKIYKAVSSTLGPRGNTVLMESMNHTGGMTSTKDGVTVAKSIELKDPVENLAVRVVREAADRTAVDAGDGTTTSVVLARNMVIEALKAIEANPEINPNVLVREMKLAVEYYLGEIKKGVKNVGRRNMKYVATISSNNDPVIGKLIADTYKKVGENGVVTVEKSATNETYSKVTKGIKLDKGMTSVAFKNDESSDRCYFENPSVLVSSIEIASVSQVINLMEGITQTKKPLVIIAPCSNQFKQVIAANVMKGNIRAVIVEPPSFGYKQKELMSDIALATGSTYFSEETGDDLSMMVERDLGTCESISVNSSEGVIITAEANDSQAKAIPDRVDELKRAHNQSKNPHEKAHISNRIASLAGGIGVIYAGGDTSMEQKELYDRIEDAILAVRSAIEEGIVVGGGYAMYHASKIRTAYHPVQSEEHELAYNIVSKAMKSPSRSIAENAGMLQAFNNIETRRIIHENEGLNVMTGEMVDMFKEGVIDPYKVIRCALTNAASVASTILTTNAVITLARTYES